MGAGLDDTIRGELIGVIAAPAGHPDPPEGAQLRSRRHGALRAPDRRGHGADAGAADGGPGTEARRRPGAARAWPEPAGEAGWARAARARAARRLAERGAPVRRDEYWKFTDPSGLTAAAGAGGGGAGGRREADVRRHRPAAARLRRRGLRARAVRRGARWRAWRSGRWPRCWPPTSHWARELFGVLEGRGQEPVDRPLASLNTARATEGRGDPGDRAGGAADQPRLPPQRGRRRTRWCITWSGSIRAPT